MGYPGAFEDELREQVAELRELVYKLVKHIDSQPKAPVMPKPLPTDLREQIDRHVRVLRDAKLAEHKRNMDTARKEIEHLDRLLDQQLRAVEGQKAGAEKTRKALEEARARLGLASVLKDEEILP